MKAKFAELSAKETQKTNGGAILRYVPVMPTGPIMVSRILINFIRKKFS